MAKKKKMEFKAPPFALRRPPNALKIANEFAKRNLKKEAFKNAASQSQQKNVIEPLVRQLDDGTYISTPTNETFEDLFQLIANLK